MMENRIFPLVVGIVFMMSTAVSFAQGRVEEMRRQRNAETKGNSGADDFDAFMQNLDDDFDAFMEDMDEEYESYMKQLEEDYQNYMKGIENVWGASTIDNSPLEWVSYSKDRKSRSIVNFDDGEISVEIALDPVEANDNILVNRKLEKAVETLLENPGSTNPFESKVVESKPIIQEPVMNKSVDTRPYGITDNSTTTEANRKKIADAIVSQAPREVKSIIGNDGKKRVVVAAKAKVVDDLMKRAEQYRYFVERFGKDYNVEKALIYGIMEQESRFRPTSISPKKAVGLMQLVPSSGGCDAYMFVHNLKTKTYPSQEYLFNEENNIRLGTAYLHILQTRYFKDVINPNCRRLCVIAAYNTGAGNVSRAFIGSTKLRDAIPYINRYDYNSLYNYLKDNLSEKEARNYVVEVSKRRLKYIGF